jgi:hypothetical protein
LKRIELRPIVGFDARTRLKSDALEVSERVKVMATTSEDLSPVAPAPDDIEAMREIGTI